MFLAYALAFVGWFRFGRDSHVFLLAGPITAAVAFGGRLGGIALAVSVILVVLSGEMQAPGIAGRFAQTETRGDGAYAWIVNAVLFLVAGGGAVLCLSSLRVHLSGLRARLGGLDSELEQAHHELSSQGKDLDEARALLSRQDTVLRALAQALAEVILTARLDEVLGQVAHLIGRWCGWHHVGIYVIDRKGDWAELRAAYGDGGQRMLARNHHMRVGLEGIVGHVAGCGVPYVAADVTTDPIFYEAVDLPGIRSEIAVPLIYAGQAIGALDVQETAPNAFSEGDIATMEALAAMVTVAVHHSCLGDQDRDGSVKALDVQHQGNLAWSTRWARRLGTTGYRYENGTVRRLADAPDSGLPSSDEVASAAPELRMPISVRGSAIAEIIAHKPEARGAWTGSETELMESLASQLGMALEGVRLYDETQRQSLRERQMREIGTHMQSTVDLDVILRTAVEDLARALDVPLAFVQLYDAKAPADE
jgi:GAF domain-containing protein